MIKMIIWNAYPFYLNFGRKSTRETHPKLMKQCQKQKYKISSVTQKVLLTFSSQKMPYQK
ncbi:hypothetical protein IX84_27280 [Phaeodactylibacter xiamenensis]|uniref:Uncharacterized protein n=1 Tax=Phaeodactylibacter xiamenensis TaxID=1524460 RepID=A0A098RYI8_9BACT|nr:hypothetical protein IX84_27280 [Phaeodactylibacter xiamenensis]